MRKWIPAVLMSFALPFSCGGPRSGGETPGPAKARPVIGLIIVSDAPEAVPGLVESGLTEAAEKFGLDKSVRFCGTGPTGVQNALRTAIETDLCDLLFIEGLEDPDLLAAWLPRLSSARLSAVRFVVLDGRISPRNGFGICSAVFAVEEAAFVAGVLAARVSATKKVGFLGGKDRESSAYLYGFEQGLLYSGAERELLYGPETPSSAGDSDGGGPGSGDAAGLFRAGADVVFAAPSRSGPGAFSAAAEAGGWIIATRGNQDALAPGHVLTSIVKRLDTAVMDLTGLFLQGRLREGAYRYGYAERGLRLTVMERSRIDIMPRFLREAGEIESRIGEGNLKVKAP